MNPKCYKSAIPARLLADGKLVVGAKGIYGVLRCWLEAAQGK